MRAAMLDMDTGVRPPTHAGHHLNHAGKVIQLKKIRDQGGSKMAELQGDPLTLPGTNRKFA